YSSSEEYARAKERVEFNSLLRYLQVAKKINNQCSSDLGPYLENDYELFPFGIIGLENLGFENFYTYVIPPSHKEVYRKHWKQIHGDDSPSVANDSSNVKKYALDAFLMIGASAFIAFAISQIFKFALTPIRT
ncbi:MAG TPA: hypothetical protein VGP47_01480, partial [Parachlamydiaceae bacterium]|nr:hypothetical protein [Parachlamydiaceae bacterium]